MLQFETVTGEYCNEQYCKGTAGRTMKEWQRSRGKVRQKNGDGMTKRNGAKER